jgi:hypothetical protein
MKRVAADFDIDTLLAFLALVEKLGGDGLQERIVARRPS